MKYDLSNATFIIPIRIESSDRMRNVITILCYLLEKFDTQVIVKEVDEKSVFVEDVLPQIKDYIDGDLSNLTHVFEKSDDPVFYRMKIINEMIDMSKTDIIVNYDCDVLLEQNTCLESVKMIQAGYDMVYPYGFGNYQKQVFADDELVSEFLSNDCDFSILNQKSRLYDAQYGHVQFVSRKSYIESGMENENFRGSSPEDKERYYRFTTMGYNVGRIDHYVYHLEHSRSRNSWPVSYQMNPYMSENISLWEKLNQMTKEELQNYYSTQEYLKKYDNR